MAIERPASCDLTKGLKRLKNDGWQAAVSYHRPQSLNLEICCSHNGKIPNVINYNGIYIGVTTFRSIFFEIVSVVRVHVPNMRKCYHLHTNIQINIYLNHRLNAVYYLVNVKNNDII